MAYFDHIAFERLLGDLSLQPLSPREVDVARRMVAGEEIVAVPENAEAVVRLEGLRLAEHGWIFDADGRYSMYRADAFLCEIADRGLLPRIGVR